MDRVERVEELFLGPFLVGDELDVIDQEQIDPPIARPELVDLALRMLVMNSFVNFSDVA